MKPSTLLPARTVVQRLCWSSTSYGSVRPNAVLVPHLTHPISSLDVLAPLPDGQLAYLSARHQRTLLVAPLHNTPRTALKSP